MEKNETTMSQRIYKDYPWPVWTIGWIAVLKALVWLASEPNLPENQLFGMGCKYAGFMVPWLVCAFGAWRMRRWAAWGVGVLGAADLLFFFVCPFALPSLGLNPVSPVTHVLSLAVFVINGPVTAVAILVLVPVLFNKTRPTN